MRRDLDHLTIAKQQEIRRVVSILFEEFAKATAGSSAAHNMSGRILKIILFGSYARDDWVVDPVGGYFSDLDVLVVVNHRELTEAQEYWTPAEDRLLRDLQGGGPIRTPVNLIVHTMADVNAKLSRGRPFFVDIVRDGILLHDTAGHPFATAKPLSREAALQEAESLFREWFSGAGNLLSLARQAVAAGMPKEAAFLLHQATERLYHSTLLVLTLYSPKSHKLNFLRGQAERLSPSLIAAWPRESRAEQRGFELLRRAYVDARYSPHYKITTDELAWLVERIEELQRLVGQVAAEHLRGLEGAPTAREGRAPDRT